MLVLKIMSAQDLADADPRKEFTLVSDVVNVNFYTDKASNYEKTQLGFEGGGDLTVSFARCLIADSGIPGGRREITHLLTGNCYVLNDRGKTIESFWARRNHQGEQVGEK